MHTVRNRVASRPRPPAVKRTIPRTKDAFLLLTPTPPAFPPHLILPPARGAVIRTIPWPENAECGVVTARSVAKRSKKTRKVATRKNAIQKRRKAGPKKAAIPRLATKPTPFAAPDTPLVIEDTRPMFANDLLERALAVQPDAAPPEQANPQPAKASAGTALPDTADQSAGSQPLPRSRMLTVHRGSGMVEAIGRWLSTFRQRLASRTKASREDRMRLSRAERRHRALQVQAKSPTPPSA